MESQKVFSGLVVVIASVAIHTLKHWFRKATEQDRYVGKSPRVC